MQLKFCLFWKVKCIDTHLFLRKWKKLSCTPFKLHFSKENPTQKRCNSSFVCFERSSALTHTFWLRKWKKLSCTPFKLHFSKENATQRWCNSIWHFSFWKVKCIDTHFFWRKWKRNLIRRSFETNDLLMRKGSFSTKRNLIRSSLLGNQWPPYEKVSFC